MTERKLASVQVIAEIKPIDGADLICAYRINGWWIVDQVGKYQVGDMVVYCETDSWVPTELAPFLSKGKEPREYQGVKGERLRTIKLKGQLSQGLLLPLAVLDHVESELFEGLDVTFPLGIIKWEKEIPANLAGQVKGNFPEGIPKTDQERIQNLSKVWDKIKKDTYTVTEKLDGTSCTIYWDNEGELHVCSRNLDLKDTEGNVYWNVVKNLMLPNTALILRNIALQGEIVGTGIQNNQYKCEQKFYLFDAFIVEQNGYDTQEVVTDWSSTFGLNRVPVIDTAFKIPTDWTIDDLLKYADGPSLLNGSKREGLVFQSNTDPSKSFKVISNAWLLKSDKE